MLLVREIDISRWEKNRNNKQLIKSLKYRNWYIRSCAAYALGRIGHHEAVEPLIDALSDICENVRSSAAAALGFIGDQKCIGPLINSLNDENDHVRIFSAYSLGKMKANDAVLSIIQLLKDKAINVRQVAAKSLGDIGDKRAVIPLINMFNDYIDVRLMAVKSLGAINDNSAYESLYCCLCDEDDNVRKAVAESLKLMGDDRWVTLVRGDADDYERLIRTGEKTLFTPLLDAFNKSNKHKPSIARALGILKNKEAVPHLLKYLDHESEYVRYEIVNALKSINDISIKEDLLKMLWDPYDKVIAVTCETLFLMGDKRWKDITIDDNYYYCQLIEKGYDTEKALLHIKKLLQGGGFSSSSNSYYSFDYYISSENIARKRAVYALGVLDNENIENMLIEIIHDSDHYFTPDKVYRHYYYKDIVKAATDVFIKKNRDSALHYFINYICELYKPDELGYDLWNHRVKIFIEQLGQIGDVRSVNVLLQVINDDLLNLKTDAFTSLIKICEISSNIDNDIKISIYNNVKQYKKTNFSHYVKKYFFLLELIN